MEKLKKSLTVCSRNISTNQEAANTEDGFGDTVFVGEQFQVTEETHKESNNYLLHLVGLALSVSLSK